MASKRIYEVAKQYNISSNALVQMLRDLDHTVKSHMSIMDEKMVLDVNMRFEQEKLAARQEQDRKKKMAASETKAKPKTVKEGPSRARPKAEAGKPARKDGAPATQAVKGDGDVRGRRRRSKKKKKAKVDQKEVEASVRRTIAQMDSTRTRRRRRRGDREEGEADDEALSVIRVPEFISAGELAEHLSVSPTEIVSKCLQLGLMITINQRLDMDTLMTVASEFGFDIEEQSEYGLEYIEEDEEEEDEGVLVSRPPVVTIMGHVDHGKTSLLDYIRKSNVIAGEAGGITQHIGAYEVDLESGQITFLDTPGHEAFSAMRARGTQVTDIVILVVAADEEVMPQTIEAIDHAKAAEVPIIIALNKMDLETARPDRIKEQLSQRGLLVEDWGGDVIACEVSALTGAGVDHILEMVLLQSEMLDLKANPDRRAQGVVVEAELDRGRGTLATVLIQQGTLRVGDAFVAGQFSGRVRALLNERGARIVDAGPSVPVQIMGFSGMPQVGDSFAVVESESLAREIGNRRRQMRREHEFRQARPITLEDIYDQIKEGEIQELPVIVKGDVGGSVEALSDSLLRLENDEVKIRIIHTGIGAINESDVLLATASNAIIIGFHVRPNAQARALAEREQVDIRLYDIIYRVIQDVTDALEGMLKPDIEEQVVGVVEVREIFRAPRVGTIAGCYVQSGNVTRNANIRLIRDGIVVYESTVGSLRRFKEDVREVQTGFECGLTVDGFQDIKQDDTIEVYETREVARQLQTR
ncbi:MAG: translation initiation factor IF-2 [Gemmatimonadetes bacterium]|nr:translation initiation factor IF-2 [Gemmatimonadota bacterium]MYG85025.1 translation initiation factor IF-2 [Gemmatimonadota bacterium]MYJ89186.1 translation initiation factor IF-2 [Gemmatimonadota bacterium]